MFCLGAGVSMELAALHFLHLVYAVATYSRSTIDRSSVPLRASHILSRSKIEPIWVDEVLCCNDCNAEAV